MNNLIAKSEALEILDGLDFEVVVTQVTKRNPESQYHDSRAYLNLKTGKVEYHVMGTSSDFAGQEHFCLFSQPGNFKHEIDDELIAGDDEIPEGGVYSSDDYEQRVLECVIYGALHARDEKTEAYNCLKLYYDLLEAAEYPA